MLFLSFCSEIFYLYLYIGAKDQFFVAI